MIYHPNQENWEKGRETINPYGGRAHWECPQSFSFSYGLSVTARADFHIHASEGSDWIEALWGLRTIVFPSPCDSPHYSMAWCLHIYFRMISVPHSPLLSSGWVLWQALAQQQGSAASAIVRDGLQRAPSSQQQPKGSCKFYLRTTLQGSPLTLRM